MSNKDLRKMSAYDGLDTIPFEVSYVPSRTGYFVINITKAIESVEQFSDAIRVLEAADESNPVVINLQCIGGSLDATDALLHAMRKCKGPIHIVASGGCHSCATFILLEADSFELSENFNALLHCGSLGTVGNTNEYVAKTAFDAQFIPKVLRTTYEGFLSEEELEKLIEGRDIWLDTEGWMKRWNNRNEYFKAKAEMSTDPTVLALLGAIKDAEGDEPVVKRPRKKRNAKVPDEN